MAATRLAIVQKLVVSWSLVIHFKFTLLSPVLVVLFTYAVWIDNLKPWQSDIIIETLNIAINPIEVPFMDRFWSAPCAVSYYDTTHSWWLVNLIHSIDHPSSWICYTNIFRINHFLSVTVCDYIVWCRLASCEMGKLRSGSKKRKKGKGSRRRDHLVL